MPTPLPAKVPPNVAEEIPWYHPESRYEEPWKDAYLTLFDVHRKPRRIMDHPNQRVSLPLKLLGNEFQCPIRLGYMKGTSIVMECLHRFCRDCIQKCLRLGKKQCPSCRIHIPSRRSLRPDPKFDLLIKHMCGNLDDLEKQEEKEIEILNMSKHMNNTCTESRRKGILQQHNQRKKYNSSRLSNSRIDPVQGGSSSINNTVGGVSGVHQKSKARQRPSIINLKPSPLLEFLLRRHPQERRVDRLAREQLKVNIEATVGLLKTFLSRKLNYAPSGHFQILSTVSDTSVILDDSITLEEIRRELYDVAIEEMITLQYRIFPPSCETSTTGTNTL